MHGSIYSQAVDAAREKATALGHKLGGFGVIRCAAYAACGPCGAGVSVLFYSPVAIIGNAVEMPCEFGEANVAPPVQPKPPTGKAKRLPKTQPAPTFDDVPFPTEAPLRDAVVLR
jgi:hypothetical protein